MSENITGFITWLRSWFDDIYSSISHSHGNLTDTGTITVLNTSVCEYFAGIPNTNTNKVVKCRYLNSTRIKNADSLSNIGSSANATQSSINSNINTALGNKADKDHTHDLSSLTGLVDLVYPVGSIYMSVNDVNPATLFGGTWVQIKDRFLLAKGDSYTTNGATGGEASHTLTASEMPAHSHPFHWNDGSGNKTWAIALGWNNKGTLVDDSNLGIADRGGGQAHNNMPPYLVVNIWKRTA